MAYGTGPAMPADRAIEDTYERVLSHTADCPPCNTPGASCTTGNQLRAAHRQAQTQARR